MQNDGSAVAVLGYMRWSQGAALVSVVGGALLYGSGTHPVAGFMLIVAAIYLAMLTYLKGKTRILEARAVVENRRVVVDGVTALAQADIASAYLQPQAAGRSIVRVRARKLGRSLDLLVRSDSHGRALLEQLGQDPSRATARLRVRSGIRNGAFRAVVGFMSVGLVFARAFRNHSALGGWLVVAFALAMLVATLLPTTLT